MLITIKYTLWEIVEQWCEETVLPIIPYKTGLIHHTQVETTQDQTTK